jgi:hypothetical protein
MRKTDEPERPLVIQPKMRAQILTYAQLAWADTLESG